MAQWTTTYADLIALLEAYVEDGSTEYADAVQGCVNRAEERLLRDLDLSIFNSVITDTTVIGQGYIVRTESESPVHNVFFTAAAEHAQRRSREYIQAHGGSGRPTYYVDDASNIYFAPVPDAGYAVAVTYVSRPAPLSPSNSTNWLAENAANLLLLAALIESERFLIAPERAAEFTAEYGALLGPARAFWRNNAQTAYEPIAPVVKPEKTR